MLKKLLTNLEETWAMSRSQVIGSLALLLLLGALWIIYPAVERLFSQSSADITITTTQRLDSLVHDPTPEWERSGGYSQERNYGNRSYGRYDAQGDASQTAAVIKRFNFDPNTAPKEDLLALGLPKGVVTNLLNYRAKGGRLRYREDIRKIYFFPQEMYPALSPYIQLPSREELAETYSPQTDYRESYGPTPKSAASVALAAPAATPTATALAAEPAAPRVAKLANPATQTFDLNTADTTQLKQVRGIGSGYAVRIIKYRDALGGFYDTKQVKNTFGLPPEAADELLRFAVVRKPVRKIPINTITLDAFKHPALKYHQKKALLAYRDQHGPLKSPDDLQAIKVLDPDAIQQIAPYLDFK